MGASFPVRGRAGGSLLPGQGSGASWPGRRCCGQAVPEAGVLAGAWWR